MMNILKRIISLVGVIVLAASSLLASDVMAQSIGTTITVDNSTPACVDENLNELSLSYSQTQFDNVNFWTLTGSGTNFNNKETPGSLIMNMYVNECMGQGWAVTASITDFYSGSNIVGAVGRVGVYAQTGAATYGISYALPVRPTGTATSPYEISRQVPGTTGLPTSANGIGGRQFVSAGPGIGTLTHTVSTGTTESTGEMVQAIKMGLVGVPTTTPAGTYSATLTLTFTPTGP